jgi:hypothetical protein
MPLPIDKLRAVKKIIVHKSCADGMASAVILHDVLPDAEIRFILYNTPEHTAMEPEEGLLICNFSPPGVNRSEAMDLEAKAEIEREIGERYAAAGTMLLDHHRQAKDIVMGFGDMGVFADEIERPGIAGANLAYEEVWIPLCGERDSYEQHNVETIARLSGIRDTWRRNDPEWKPACYLAEAFRFFPAESWIDKSDTFSQIHQSWWAERRIMGKTLFERTEKAVKRAIENSWRFTTPLGTRVVMFSGTRLSSDAAELLHEDADFVVGFDYMGVTDNQTASLVYSTRSHTGYDCGAFCKAHGGGGHTPAAGFTLKFNPLLEEGANPFITFRGLLEAYEAQKAVTNPAPAADPGRNQPVAVDDLDRPYCRRHGHEVAADYDARYAEYERTRAARKELLQDAAALGVNPSEDEIAEIRREWAPAAD